jgi:hypothetical protein
MSRVRCFLLEPTDRVSQKLRRYSHNNRWDAAAQRTVYDDPCPLTGGYHNAEARIEDAAPIWREDETTGDTRVLVNGSRPEDVDALRADPRWPEACACGYRFAEDERQLFCELIYRRVDSGEETTLRDAPPGAMWLSPWLDAFYRPQLAHNLVVKLPDGTDWQVDSQASNCTMKDDFKQARHHCWVISGAPPDVTAGKDGPTCGAGAGSIQSPRYHGFLRAGWLED